MKTVFMGTPDFSVSIAEALAENGFDVAAVVTQPDKAAGRGNKLRPSPVKQWAQNHGITVFQPEKVRAPEFVDIMRSVAPQLIVTAAFGQIIPKEILDMPQFGCVNVHASLLPKYRGASPIQQALFDGETYTGISLMYMNEKMDEGDIIIQQSIEILPEDNAGTLFEKLADIGKNVIGEYAVLLKNGKPCGTPQNAALATYCKKINKEQGNIDWTLDSYTILNTIRAMTPAPGAYSFLNGKRIKILSVCISDGNFDEKPGKIICKGKNTLTVVCGKGALNIIMLQPEGKSVQHIKDFLNGYKLTAETEFERNI